MKKRLILLVFFSALFVLERTGIADTGKDAALRVSCNVPLSGALATYGSAIQEGVQFALERLPDGARLSFDWEDNQSEAKQAVSVLMKQLKAPTDIYVSGGSKNPFGDAYDMSQIMMDVARRAGSNPSKERLRAEIQSTGIQGITGPLRFDEKGDLPASVALGVVRNGRVVENEPAPG